MRTVHVAAGKPYDVYIGRGLMDQAGSLLLKTLGRTCAVAVLTDDNVDPLYGARVARALEAGGYRACRFTAPHGEKNKNLATWETMLEFLARERITRTDAVLALGGGVAGDMAGFAAACYLRGVDLIQIPTTLLAMIDSSVGGKTGVNLNSGKNQAGAFHQPRAVLCDPDALLTLAPDAFRDGVSEAVKYGVLNDVRLFELLAGGRWLDELEWVIETCVAQKAALVMRDELDAGQRQLLNLGHTLGHGIEKCSRFEISHGQAVAVGMAYAARLARALKLCGPEVPERIREALVNNGLPVSAPFGAEALAEAALSDKKRAGDAITLVLPYAIGRCGLEKVEVNRLSELVALALNG